MKTSLSLFFFFLFLPTLFASDSAEQLKLRAAELDLAEKRYWRILLHYKETLFGSWESQQDFHAFFQAEDGKTSPENELMATIDAFFLPEDYKDPSFGIHPQCQLPARLNWLREQLETSELKFPVVACPFLDKWLERLDTEKVSLIFPASKVNLPASMFGHTFLKMHKKNRKGGDLFNYAVNFAAQVDLSKENPLFYSVRGVFGYYDGYFSILPYYTKIREYEDVDLRDLWEYELSLTPEEVNRFMLRLWELRLTKFDYFFFKENCSYHLLSLLEAARPSLILQDRFTFWSIPSDTVRALNSYPGLITKVSYRKSRRSRAIQQKEMMTDRQFDYFSDIASKDLSIFSSEFQNLDVKSQAVALDLLIDYMAMDSDEFEPAFRKDVLGYRAELKIPAKTLPEKFYSQPPDQGHKTKKAEFFIGGNNLDDGFLDLTIRPSYHELTDYSYGYEPFATISFMKTSLRYYEKKGLALNHLNILDVKNLNTTSLLDDFPPPFIWSLDLGFKKAFDKSEYDKNKFYFDAFGGFGKSFHNLSAYLAVAASLNYGDSYEGGYRGGFGPGLIFFHPVTENINWYLEHFYMNFTDGDSEHFPKTKFSLHYGNKIYDYKLSVSKINEYQEASFGFGYFFD